MHKHTKNRSGPGGTWRGIASPRVRGDGSRAARPAAPTVVALAAVALALVPLPAPAQESRAAPADPDRPNIVFIFSDDHAAHALSAYRPHLGYGALLPDTPELDRLAAEGVLFTNAFVTNSICAPSRAAVLTGQYGHLNGVMTNVEALHPTEHTFPELLQADGYRTALFGKWHLKAEPEGFDHSEVLVGQGPYHNPVLVSGDDSVRYTGYTTDIIVDRAIRWLSGTTGGATGAGGAGSQGQPFLLMIQPNAVHRYWDPGPDQLHLYRDTALAEPATFWDEGHGRARPFNEQEMEIGRDLFARDLKLETPPGLTPEQQAAWEAAYGPENEALAALGLAGTALTRWKYQRYIGDYMRVVAGLDAAVGRVLRALEARGLADNTVVVYTSDQGFFLGDHGWFDKRWMYEESLRTPLLVRWPGVVRPASVNRELVMNLDLAQTLLELGAVEAPPSMQGRSLVPLLRGERPGDWRDAIYYQYFAYPDWHMVHRQHGVRTHRYKLIHFYEIDEWELYDLARDPNELQSVYDEPAYAAIAAELKARLRELREQYRVPEVDPVPHRPFDPPAHLRRGGEGQGR